MYDTGTMRRRAIARSSDAITCPVIKMRRRAIGEARASARALRRVAVGGMQKRTAGAQRAQIRVADA